MRLRHHKPRKTRGGSSPLVEAVSKYHGEWEIVETQGTGSTTPSERKMAVPLDDEPCRCGGFHNHAIRGHELLHSKLSPPSKEAIKVRYGGKEVEVSSANVEVAEEFRINYSLATIEGRDRLNEMICPISTQSAVDAMMDQRKYQDVIRYAIAGGPGHRYNVQLALATYKQSLMNLEGASPKFRRQQIKIANALGQAISEYENVARRIMSVDSTHTLPAWSQTAELAAFLQANLDDLDERIQGLIGDRPGDLAALAGEDSLDPNFDEFVKDESEDGPGYKPTIDKGLTGPVDWGPPAEFEEADMPLKVPAWKLQRANRAVEEGTIPRYMHRWPSDKRVFHRTKWLPGGSILVDDSASMELTHDDLEAILDALPVATVAIYAGKTGGRGGKIRVVAKDGKRAKTVDLSIAAHPENVIDGQALEWLGQQPYPRIWISDGGVSDANLDFGPRVKREAARLCVEHSITLVETAEEAAEILKKGNFAR